MSTIVEYGRFVADGPTKVGDLGVRTEGYPCSFIPHLPGGFSVFRYQVPVNNKLTIQGLSLSMMNGNDRGSGQAAAFRAGVVKLKASGVDKFESSLIGKVVTDFLSIAGAECPSAWNNYSALFDFHDGITFATGETFSLTITPASSISGSMVKASAICTTASGALLLHGTLSWIATTADQTILTYTPVADTTLKSINFTVIGSGSVILAGGRVEVNGMVAHEFGPMGMDYATPVFFGLNNTGSQGAYHIHLNELELQQGDTVEIFVHPTADMGHVITASLFGETTSYGGGSGGSGISRSRILARV